jgi:hypothetical protein
VGTSPGGFRYGVVLSASSCSSIFVEVRPVLPFCYQHIYNVIELNRARVYACKRMWDKAKHDYASVLSWYPDHEGALAGMSDVTQESVTIPLSDEGAIYDDS